MLASLERKVLYKDQTRQSAKISIPRWWLGKANYVELQVFPDKIVVKRLLKEE